MPPLITLPRLVQDFANAMTAADSRNPQWVSQRSGRAYSPGIGPHAENAAVALTLAELRHQRLYQGLPLGQFLPYVNSPKQKCDVWLGDPPLWAIEVKMARFKGDNGKPDDTALKDLLSPYEADRSALTDCIKLARDPIARRKALIVYGFDYPERPLDPAIDALELLARHQVDLGERQVSPLGPLFHPVHSVGRVFGWEVASLFPD
jgi:hypothetical protein